ncbi:glycosyltransferase family 4 protein [Glaesserella parasuis]|nr:glycosyltransferase family 4 protein [Glaesserella parasuis]EQA04542.1 glycosyl transferases group 1 family protein [Glaesserella parasuis MN-H]MCT8595048.1 glycosyltransferase family 4 protein [Glaesserella parasuis]MCT8634967.1 glycosyltransferase family 4 protein [Glaesserella parasuis]MCT8716492.1 glycosyltransferase family 4 protein [Glaesserella parasuis]MCT8718679.1 glycosyltransferase family 4 protein [Glaesserella parasuis]
MKNIAFLVLSLDVAGGVERVVTTITNSIVSLNTSNIFVLNFYGNSQPFFHLDKRIKFTYLYDKKSRMSDNFVDSISKIRVFLKENNIEELVVVDIGLTIQANLACFGLNINKIFWNHGNYLPYNNERIPFRIKLARCLVKTYFSHIITLTERDKSEWIKFYSGRAKVSVVLNPSSYDITNVNPDIGNKVILSIGRMEYQKGFDLLIESWAKIKDKKGWKLHIVGDGKEKDKLSFLIKKYNLDDSIVIYPFSSNVSDLYRSSSVYCMSSRFEGLPLVLIEAISFGLPVVSFDCYMGPAEIIKNSGILCEPENIESLSKALSYFLSISEDEYNLFSKNAQKDAERFCLSKIINDWKNILDI